MTSRLGTGKSLTFFYSVLYSYSIPGIGIDSWASLKSFKILSPPVLTYGRRWEGPWIFLSIIFTFWFGWPTVEAARVLEAAVLVGDTAALPGTAPAHRPIRPRQPKVKAILRRGAT